MKKVLLFTGAGMSVPMGLPAATGFQGTIKKCEPALFNMLSNYLGESNNDIEKILYVLEEVVNGSKFLKHLMNQNNNDGTFEYVNQKLAVYYGYALKFQQDVKHDIYKILRKFESVKALDIYLNLFKSFKTLHPSSSLSIFTTNYDLIFEDILIENPSLFEGLGYTDFYFGFTTKWGKMMFDQKEDFKWSSQIIEFNKLHGSLDWTKDNNGVVVKTGAITLPAAPDDMPLLYPGYKGTPSDEPFISIHNKLYLRLIESDVVYVVGFAFRDPYINSIFEFALRANPKLEIFCYNPLSVESLPEESAIPKFITNNKKQFNYIKEGITDSKDPLNILSSK